MTRLPLCQARTRADRRLQHVVVETKHHLRNPIVVVREPQVTYGFFSQIMSYILSMLICVDIILLDNLLQYFMLIAMIDLYRTCDSTAVLICKSLVMFMSYSWIKVKLKVLIFPTIQKPYYRYFSFMPGFVDTLKPARGLSRILCNISVFLSSRTEHHRFHSDSPASQLTEHVQSTIEAIARLAQPPKLH
jgi:hypothetical protein